MSSVTESREMTAAQAKQAGPLKRVTDRKVYTAALQLGSARRWREFGGGQWDKDPTKERGMRHVPAIHKIGPFSGSTINGLIQEHNEWVKANEDNQVPQAYVNRQLLIYDIRESQDQPLDAPVDNRLTQSSLKEIVATAVREAVSGVLNALSKPQGTAAKSTSQGDGKDSGDK